MKKTVLTVSDFECTRGGLTIRGQEYRGEGENLPVCVVSHGFMANMASVRQYAVAAAGLGFAAYIFDFCGGCLEGKSDGKMTDMTVLTEVEDLLAVVEYAKSVPGNDRTRVSLIGASQGGFVSALLAARLGKEIRRLVLLYPALCIPDDARAGKNLMFSFDPDNVPEVIGAGPLKIGGGQDRRPRLFPARPGHLQRDGPPPVLPGGDRRRGPRVRQARRRRRS